ncbi:helix-turn-helix domain-containing protein [Clostridioides difficile]|uniref:helix-turn-helix domain-containing protein n=1 Tax=Clostridioides difficile TaxID=1496 RepID=UPI002A1A50A7|nr:helix-turn-helix domain-containing protein [Clostridioides difficile]
MDLLRDARKKDWFWLENDLIDNLNLNVYEKMTYIVLARHANSESVCFPSNQTIAKKVGCSINTVRKAVNALEEKQLIKKTARKKNEKENDSNLYCIMSAKGISRDDIPIAGDDRGVYHEMTYPIAGDDRGVCHQVIGNNTNINNTNISNNTQSKKSLKNDRTDSDAHGNNESNLYYIASLNGGLCENLGSERPQGRFCENLGVGSMRAPKKTYNKKTYIKSNTTTQKESKTDYLDLSFLDLDIEKVKLTKDEYDKLISKFGKKYIHDKIVSLENYIVNGKGSRYKSHYRALLTWGNGDASKGIVPEVTKTKNPLSGFKEL